jgi:hypothetical protein
VPPCGGNAGREQGATDNTDVARIRSFRRGGIYKLHRTETSSYRDNLASGAPALWIVLRPTASELPYELVAVTADPAEGEGFTGAGNNLVEQVPMPPDIAEMVGQFVARHHIDRPFVKRRRDGQTLPHRKEGEQ